jgi:predicted regulator of Ras-like GTPase activity (Roadblock/LC7/MglB family)
MSASSQGIKVKFTGFLKRVFNKSTPADTAVVDDGPLMEESPAAAEPPPVVATARAAHDSNGGYGGAQAPAAVNGLVLPLKTVLPGFPLELRPKIRKQDAGDLTITVPYDKVLSQLSSGVVKIPFGLIRRAVPQVFAPGIESDQVGVPLPLNEILSRLNPALLTRRPVQKRLEVPAEIESPFAGNGDGLALGVGNTQPEAPAAPAPAGPRAQPATIIVTPTTKSGETTTFRRISPKTMLPQQPAAAAPMSPASLPPPTPLHVPAPSADFEAPIFQRKPAAPPTPPTAASPMLPKPSGADIDEGAIFQRKPLAPQSAPPASQPPIAPVKPAASSMPITPATPPPVEPAAPPRPKDYFASPPVPRSIQPAKPSTPTAPPVAASSGKPAATVATIPLPLAALADTWPDAVRQEIVDSKLVDARLAMPAELVESALKRGRVAFPWKTIRSWVRPVVAMGSTANDSTELELPLSVIAPLFLARQKAAGKQPRPATIDETIPNLFFGLPRPEPATTPKPADTNYYVWGDTSDNARVDDTDFKRKAGGTDFVSRYATPNEIVSRASALEGVAGVLIALPDGLMVANNIPPEFNGDTLAAFLPQIFSKVSQCTKELRMGELNNLNFTIGNVPWKIFRVNAIFFAAFGRAGEPLPAADLAGLAAELDRKRTS